MIEALRVGLQTCVTQWRPSPSEIPGTHSDLIAGSWRGDYYRYESVGRELADSVVGLVG